MTEQAIGCCSACGSWASLAADLCSRCRQIADLPHGRMVTVPIDLVASGLPLQALVLASAGFTPARIAVLLGADEADVLRVLEG